MNKCLVCEAYPASDVTSEPPRRHLGKPTLVGSRKVMIRSEIGNRTILTRMSEKPPLEPRSAKRRTKPMIEAAAVLGLLRHNVIQFDLVST